MSPEHEAEHERRDRIVVAAAAKNASTPMNSMIQTSNTRLAIANEPTVHSTKMIGMMIVRGIAR